MQTVTLRKINADKKACDRKLERIRNDLQSGEIAFSGFMLSSKNRIGNMTKEEFIEKCKSNWQSFADTVKRRDYLNTLNIQYFGGRESIVEQMKIGGAPFLVTLPKFNGCDKFDKSDKEVLTIAQAIGRKNFLNDRVIPLLKGFKVLTTKTIQAYDNILVTQKEKLMRQVNSQFGSDSTQSAKERIAYQDSLEPIYAVTWIDPLNIKDKVTELLDQMEEYLTEIDSAISRATETTEVEIED